MKSTLRVSLASLILSMAPGCDLIPELGMSHYPVGCTPEYSQQTSHDEEKSKSDQVTRNEPFYVPFAPDTSYSN